MQSMFRHSCRCIAFSVQSRLRNVVSEDRAHNLRIMRPTRYQLRYHRLIRVLKVEAHVHALVGESSMHSVLGYMF